MQRTQPDCDNESARHPWAVLDTVADGFVVLDRYGTLRYLNPAWQRLLEQSGATANSFRVGSDYMTSYSTAFPPHDDNLHTLTSGVQAVLQGQCDEVELDYAYRTSEQSGWLHIIITPCLVDGERGALVQQRDITSHRHRDAQLGRYQQVEAAHVSEVARLRAENQRIEQMLALMPLAVIELDHRGMVRYWNASAERIFGWSADAMIGQNLLLHLIPNITRDQIRQHFSELIDEANEPVCCIVNTTSDGQLLTCQWHTTVLRSDAGTITGVLLLIEDITEQVKVEQERTTIQERMIEAQQESLRELSTPLIPISDRTVVMPLIGSLNRWRSQQMMQTLLTGIEQHQVRVAILDITGVSSVDAQIAHDLVRTAQAVRLLGAQIVLTGIRPDVAQTLVHLGIDLTGIVTRNTLQRGIAYALRQCDPTDRLRKP